MISAVAQITNKEENIQEIITDMFRKLARVELKKSLLDGFRREVVTIKCSSKIRLKKTWHSRLTLVIWRTARDAIA